jgi:hypothetical protein
VNVQSGEHKDVTVTKKEWGFFGYEGKKTIPCPERVIAEPRYELRRLCKLWKNVDGSELRAQWVLWGWVPPPSEKDWKQSFGDALDYGMYSKGSYEPVTVAGVIAAMRERRKIPGVDLTREFVRLIVAASKIGIAERNRAWEENRAKEEKAKRLFAKEMLMDKMGKLDFGTKAGLLPGKKAGVILPTPEFMKWGGRDQLYLEGKNRLEKMMMLNTGGGGGIVLPEDVAGKAGKVKGGESADQESKKLIVKDRRSIVGKEK